MSKYFKLTDDSATVAKHAKGNCTCGAWATSNPSYHSEWCDHNNPMTWESLGFKATSIDWSKIPQIQWPTFKTVVKP